MKLTNNNNKGLRTIEAARATCISHSDVFDISFRPVFWYQSLDFHVDYEYLVIGFSNSY